MRSILIPLLAVLVLAGCQSTPTRDRDDTAWGDVTDKPAGPDGLRVEDLEALDAQRQRAALSVTNMLAARDTFEVMTHPSPLKRPTVRVKYEGKPPEGIMDGHQQLALYRASYVEDDTIVYKTDLAQMELIMERRVDDKPYDYRELSKTVPYGYCLDFIDENLGETSGDYKLISVTCTQDGLGVDF